MLNEGFVGHVNADSGVRSRRFYFRRNAETYLLSLLIAISLVQSQPAFTQATSAAGSSTSTAGGSAAPRASSSPMYSGQSASSDGAAIRVSPLQQSPFLGSVPSGNATSEVLALTFADAINRGLQQNLGLLLSGDNTLAARGQKWRELSNLLPNLSGNALESVQETSLAALGFKGSLFGGGTTFPSVIGPFNFFDARAYLTQSLFNFSYIERNRAASQNVKAAQFTYKDAREVVVLATGNAYLQALSGAARVEAADAQTQTAQALYNKAVDQQRAGVTPNIDTLRAQVELQARRQQLIASRNDFAKQKLALARIIGLPPGQEFTLADKAPYAPLAILGLEQSLQRAYASRADYQAAMAQVKMAEFSRKAATGQHLPSLDFSADYGAIGVSPRTVDSTYHLSGVLNIPIFQGGRAHGDVLQAETSLRQTRAQLENLRGQIDYEVRSAILDLNSAADQVAVARSSVDLAQQTLTQAQDRFAAGVTDNLEVIQAQEALATANETYIASLYAHNLAKVEFAKSIGFAEEGVKQYLRGK
jgi:outer membrane protein TolC